MAAVFVHGDSESAAVGGPALELAAYRDWLTAELEALGEPVDLVGQRQHPCSGW